MPAEYYAHTPSPREPERWHLLIEHLCAVAARAAAFAEPFRAATAAFEAGKAHDLGKFRPEFQSYLRRAHAARLAGNPAPPSRAPHAIHGAVQAAATNPIVAVLVACHHTGLQNHSELKTKLQPAAADQAAGAPIQPVVNLARQAFRNAPEPARAALHAPLLEGSPQDPANELGWLNDLTSPERERSTEFLIRMLFSCLVDADWLDTESHADPDRAAARPSAAADWPALWSAFQTHHSALTAAAHDGPVNRVRASVYADALARATAPPGLFRLTVPTGGGKTLAGLAFAIRHAMANDLRRIIVAIPYTSIIDQTADAFRRALGPAAVLEHHSAIDPASGPPDDEELQRRLLTENWDAPVIVTTTVQLFESLFANRTARCRKLHNIARSVIVLDEVQTLPPALLQPITDSLRELTLRYGVSVVLSTATQPALDALIERAGSLPPVTEIVAKPARHFEALRRVTYAIEPDPISWQALAGRIAGLPQSLTVLNTRRDALALLACLTPGHQLLHLSTLLCPAHRRNVLAEARRRLAAGLPCTLVSTQVIECGVDIDFPCVFRAIAPLDRIAQSAGRCNREGRLPHLGSVTVITPAQGGAPTGPYRTAMEEARIILAEPNVDLHDLRLYPRYFALLYRDLSTDAYGVQDLRRQLQFEAVASKVKLIGEDTAPVVVPYLSALVDRHIARVRAARTVPADTWRELQPSLVSLYQHDLKEAIRTGDVEEILPGFFVWRGFYDDLRGIGADNPDPADLIA